MNIHKFTYFDVHTGYQGEMTHSHMTTLSWGSEQKDTQPQKDRRVTVSYPGEKHANNY
jgi:hypothetical protein